MKQMKMKTKIIPLSETKELESKDLLYLRRHAKLVFTNLEQKIKLQNNNDQYEQESPPQRQQKSAWFDGDNTKEDVKGKEEVKEENNNNDHHDHDHDDQHQNQHQQRQQQQQQDQQRLRYFNSYGFCIERNFCSKNEINQLKNAMSKSVQQNWFPNNDNDNDNDNDKNDIDNDNGDDQDDDDNDNGNEKESRTATATKSATVTFGTDAKSNEARGDPFLDSSNKVSYFMEPTAMDSLTGKLKSQYYDNNDNENDNDNDNNNDNSKDNKKLLALCKAGHGLHLPSVLGTTTSGDNDIDNDNDKERKEEEGEEDNNNKKKNNIHEPFFNYSTSKKLQSLVLSLGYLDPVIAQSMYIFKNPIVGGAVHTHQDSTFLYTTPKQTCLGLWLALDDATLTNGCLWIRPKSHLEQLRRQFIRNPILYNTTNNNTDENDVNENNKNKNTDENDDNDASPSPSPSPSAPPSKLIFRNHYKDPNVTWEGKLPDSVEVVVVDDDEDDEDEFEVDDDDDDNGDKNRSDNDENDKDSDNNNEIISSSLNFVPVEVKAGDLVVFCGTLDHFSLPNFSEKQRHTFQLHLVEGPNAGITWSPENWLQYDDDDDENNKKKNKKNNGDNSTSTSTSTNSHINFLRLLDYTDKQQK